MNDRYLQAMASSNRPLPVPIERYITHLLDEVPFPQPSILLQVNISIGSYSTSPNLSNLFSFIFLLTVIDNKQ